MFVLEALVLTFMTTPLVTWLYPPHLRRRVAESGPNFDSVADEEGYPHKRNTPQEGEFKTRFTVVLDKLEHLPSMMAITQLIQPSLSDRRVSPGDRRASTSSNIGGWNPISTEALRLIELTDRVSAVMKSSALDSLLSTDPLLSIFRMFGQLNNINVHPTLSIVKFEDLAYNVVEHARNYDSDMILLPWLPPIQDAFNGKEGPTPASKSPLQPTTSLPVAVTPASPKIQSSNPFDILFKSSHLRGSGSEGMPSGDNSTISIIHSQFVRGVFSQATTDVGLFVDQSTLDSTGIRNESIRQHVFLPFFGGPDDRLALEFLVQICANSGIRGTVVRIIKTDVSTIMTDDLAEAPEDQRNMENLNVLTISSVSLPQ